MRLLKFIAALAGTALLVACAPESSRPQATGKGAIRGLNASVTAPNIAFLLEERQLTSLNYKGVAASGRWDDLEYNVNFDYRFVGDVEPTRLARVPFKLTADVDHLFVFAGSLSQPSAYIWERPLRTWDGSETVIEVDFGHAAAAVGRVDVYFDAPGTPPAPGTARATLSNTDHSDVLELPAGDYNIIVTVAGDPANVLFESSTRTYGAAANYTIVVMDGDLSIPSPFSVSVLTEAGISIEVENRLAPQTLRLFHAAFGTVAADMYRDSNFDAPLIANTAFAAVSAPADTVSPSATYTTTEAGNTGVILTEESFPVAAGRRATRFLVGRQPNLSTVGTLDDLRSREDIARIRFFQGSFNNNLVDIYLVTEGNTLENAFPRLFSLLFTTPSPYLDVAPGNYQLYVTAAGDKTIVYAGPEDLSFGAGNVMQYALVDNVDPNVIELVRYDNL